MAINPTQLRYNDVFEDRYRRYMKVLEVSYTLQSVSFQLIDGSGQAWHHVFRDRAWWHSCSKVTDQDLKMLDIDPTFLDSGDRIHNVVSGEIRKIYEADLDYVVFDDDPANKINVPDTDWTYWKLVLDPEIIALDDIDITEADFIGPIDIEEERKQAMIDFFFYPDKWEERVKRAEEKRNNKKKK